MKIKYILKKIHKRFLNFKKHPLTKQNPLGALFRYVKFNLVQYINEKPRVYNWIDGLKFYAQKGDAGIVANIYFKLFDYEDSMFLIHHLKPQDLFVDIGANVGHYSLLAASVCKANVIAFEPIPTTFSKLEKNLNLNNLSQKVKIFNIGIGAENSVLNFTKTKDVMNSVALDYETDVVSVEVKKLDDILVKENPTFLKIDVEGYEYFVLQGAMNVLKSKSLKYIIIELNFSTLKFGITNEEIFSFLVSFDFVPISYDVQNRKIIPLKNYNPEKFNTIFIKKDLLN
ncbi:FkbM family methyltransferase [Flavobacterium sp. GA093]|uniref:FkbM family methyltransferase n=1 Tax=Flavobacterium hydrocarbonoxydans TaxID=2683249 RepID=A0A6I4NPM9_9FLAO|nr:FkbM family methyltransferase [Flavobacterium hydrocarbonoxydans]MWB94525.1 FkbM family methyltransferase [Flavobacterium hydrocarbonoxydans]